MDERESQFLVSAFKRYYFDHADKFLMPEAASEREFAYQRFGSEWGMVRHLQIRDQSELRVLLLQEVPSDVYCSNSRYQAPTLPIDEKGWKGAELIFDIDAKDLGLPCREEHVLDVCAACGRAAPVAYGTKDCPACDGKTAMHRKSLPCHKCINASKKQVQGLIEVLCDDLGVEHGEIHTYFSGNEGFHLHVPHEPFFGLGSRERSDLADYIALKGLLPETMGMRRAQRPEKKEFADLGEKGWRGRFAKAAFGSASRRASTISELCQSEGQDGYSRFEEIAADAVSKIGIKIDHSVTADVHRVFRMPGSINSKSGMQKAPCPEMAEFDPYVDAIALDAGGSVSVTVADCPRFRLNGARFGPYKAETAEVPVYAAAYMVCKGLARVA